MDEEEIIKKWKQGYGKMALSIIYKRIYNQNLKMMKLYSKNKTKENYMSSLDALKHVEKVIYNYIKQMSH